MPAKAFGDIPPLDSYSLVRKRDSGVREQPWGLRVAFCFAPFGLAFGKRPPAIHGLKTRQMVDICTGGTETAEELAAKVNFSAFLDRDLNVGFSGGEIKRSELLQLMAQGPELLLIDEPESGVDLESIALVGKTIRALLRQDSKEHSCKSRREREAQRYPMGLIITHTGYILDYVSADKGQVLYEGKLSCVSNPREILRCIGEDGYGECVRCMSEMN